MSGQYVSVRSVASRLKSRFKIEMDLFDVVQGCAEALKKMGNIALGRSAFIAQVDNFCVNLPGNVWKVRGVIRLDGVPDPPVTITVQDIVFPPQIIFTMEEPVAVSEPVVLKDNYIPQMKGPWIDHVWDCPYLRFNETNIPIVAEVTHILQDDEGFPKVPEPCFFGCLFYCLFTYVEPLFILGQIPEYTMNRIEKWKNDNINQSRASMVMESLDGNERDNLFNIMTSMDRKSFNIPI